MSATEWLRNVWLLSGMFPHELFKWLSDDPTFVFTISLASKKPTPLPKPFAIILIEVAVTLSPAGNQVADTKAGAEQNTIPETPQSAEQM